MRDFVTVQIKYKLLSTFLRCYLCNVHRACLRGGCTQHTDHTDSQEEPGQVVCSASSPAVEGADGRRGCDAPRAVSCPGPPGGNARMW